MGSSGQISSFDGGKIMQTPAIYAWQVADPSVTIEVFDIPNDGRMYLGYKVTDLNNGYWAYEFALYNGRVDSAQS